MNINIYKKLALIGLTSALLAGCATNKELNFEEEVFLTRISDSGLKHFELRVAGEPNSIKTPQASRNSKQKKPLDPAAKFEQLKKTMRERANFQVVSTGYCRTGFWVVDFNRDIGSVYLRGECNEIASITDRSAFPDTLEQW